MRNPVSPSDTKDVLQTLEVKGLEAPDMGSGDGPILTAVVQGRDADGF